MLHYPANARLCSGRSPNSAISSLASVTSAFRRCGNPGCRCAKPGDPGHGPHFQSTGKIDGKTFTQGLASRAAVRKAEREIAEFRKFKTLTGEVVEVTRKICCLRPVGQEDQSLQEKTADEIRRHIKKEVDRFLHIIFQGAPR